ncbi:MAG: hypothetical protein Q9223_003252 [Gallowayella weberi]
MSMTTTKSVDRSSQINSCQYIYGVLSHRFHKLRALASRKIAKSTNTTASETESSNAMVHQHPLRSHPNVMAFANKPVSYVNDTMVEILPPIESMPLDMPEATFARVRFLGNEYWITSDPGEDTVMVGGEYVVVEKSESVKGTTTTIRETTGESCAKSCKSYDSMNHQQE